MTKKIKSKLTIFLMLICMTVSVLPVFAAYREDSAGAEEAYELYKNGLTLRQSDYTLEVMSNPNAVAPKNYDQVSFIYNWSKIRAYIYRNGEDWFNNLSAADKARQMYAATESVIDNGWKPATSDKTDEPTTPGGESSDVIDSDWDAWINPLNVPENYEAQDTIEEGAGILIYICQIFGAFALLAGFMQILLAMKDDNPDAKIKAMMMLGTGAFLAALSWTFRMLNIIV